MPRIAEKELSVNLQMKMKIGERNPEGELFTFDPGWGNEHVDPVTGQLAEFYDHVRRNMKLSSGIQLWFFVPRYRLADKSCLFRVLPKNLCVFKHYAVEVIQDEIDRELEAMLTEESTAEEELQGQLNGDNDAEERPCVRTKWLWLLWFYRNLLLIECVLRTVHMLHAAVSGAGEGTLETILTQSDYMLELRTGQPDDWLKVIIQTAWNIGSPLVPIKETQSMRDIWEWIAVHPISE